MTKRIIFSDLTLRDGQQSLAATRMTTAQALRVLKMIDDAGFQEMELWGGATLDSSVRYLKEDPWVRLEKFRETLGGSHKIRALLRGQNLFGYQPYPDDLVIAFIKQAVRSGVGIMRIFDALNDWRNLQIALLASKAYGAKLEAAISYTTSPVHTTDYFVNFALKLEDEGADRIAIKDMAGLLHPKDAYNLIGALKSKCRIPIALHSHTTTGVALLNAIIGMHLGIDTIDTCITPFAGGTSHSPVEILVVFAEEMGISHGLDKAMLLKVQTELFSVFEELKDQIPYYGKYFRPVSFEDIDRKIVNRVLKLVDNSDETSIQSALELTQQMMLDLGYPQFDSRIFEAQIPGGMYTNLHKQLEQMGQLGIMDKVLAEVPRVREDVGFVPLVTPTSQIVGSQAVFNVVSGERYSIVSNEFKMLLRGEFGRTPIEPSPEVLNKVLGIGEQRLVHRPASYLKPVLEDSFLNLSYISNWKEYLLHMMLGQAEDTYLKNRMYKYFAKGKEMDI
jgi:pyruvate/oxaloacetate carboxyltransferase